MYNEYEDKRGFPIKDFLIRLVLIIIFVLLLMWLLPMPNMKGINNTIFNTNVQTMKDSAISYFTTERLPKNVGDKVTLTLQEMLDMKLLLPFTDKNGEKCDTQKSYVTLEKKETEYLMTVHLKCKGQEDEIVVHLGCYSYCPGAICEKQEDPKKQTTTDPNKPTKPTPPVSGPSCTLMISAGKSGSSGWYVGDVTVAFKSKSSTNGAKITSFGLGTSTNYNGNETFKVTKNGYTKVFGYVKDSNGKTAVCSIEVNKDNETPNCSLTVISGSKDSSGNYISDVVIGFSSRTDAHSGVAAFGLSTSSKADYNSKDRHTVTAIGTTTVYGHVKDKAGNTKTCSIKITKKKVDEDKVSVPKCTLEIKSGTLGNNSWYVGDVVVGFKSRSTTNGATITNWGIGTALNYNKGETYTVNKDGATTITGYVKDSKGNTATCSITVKRDAAKPVCKVEVTSGTKNSAGNYISNVTVGFTSRTDAISGVDAYGLTVGSNPVYNSSNSITITANGTHTVTGYVKDKAGNVQTCKATFTKIEQTYECEWSKYFSAQYSEWGAWTTKEYSPSNPPKWGISTDQLTQNEDLGKTTSYVYTQGPAMYQTKTEKTASVSAQVCSGFNYYKITTATTTTYAIKVADDKWTYVDTVSLSGKPADTLSVRYVYVGEDWDRCGNSCTTTPYKIYHKYTRTVSTVTATDTITTSTGAKIKCTGYETKTIDYYDTYDAFVGYSQTRAAVDKYQYRTRTRKLTSAAQTKTQWSSCTNSALEADGWKLTGNKRVKP